MNLSLSHLKLTESILGASHISSYEPLAHNSRHLLWKVQHQGKDFLVKIYCQQHDPYFDHRFRREERLLSFLQERCPGLSPEIYGGSLIEKQQALLVMEYISGIPLHAALETSSSKGCDDHIQEAIRSQVRLHRVFDNYSGLIKNIANSCILDRNNLTTMVARLHLACKRISNRPVTTNLISDFRDTVFKPLLCQPQRAIHNSLSPLNMVLSDDASVIIVDFETLSVGPRVLDLAELAAFPSSLDYSASNIAQQYSEQCDELSMGNPRPLQLAIITRSLDAAGAIKHRMAQYPGATDHYHKRIEGYLSNALTASLAANLPKPIIDYLESLL